MTVLYPFTKKRTFYTTSPLNAPADDANANANANANTNANANADPNADLLARVEALRLRLEAQITGAKEERMAFKRYHEEIKTMGDNLFSLGFKSEQEKSRMSAYLKHFGQVMNPADKLKADKIISDSKKAEELFNKKITEEEHLDDSSILKLLKLQSTKEKLTQDAEDKVEAMINKAVEKGIAKQELDVSYQSGYYLARVLRLKERNDFKAEEKKIYSESSSRLSPIDHVVETMECAEPDYSDIDE